MVIIDCGANLGQGYERLIQQYSLSVTDLYMFDILPEACNFLTKKYPFAKVYNKGVWNKNETRLIKQENAIIEGVSGVGHESNILQEKYTPTTSGTHHTWTTYELECIDFSNFIKNNFQKNSDILLKIDIEGAEYEVIDSLIETNTINYIKKLHIEWHPHLRNDTVKDVFWYNNIFNQKNILLLN